LLSNPDQRYDPRTMKQRFVAFAAVLFSLSIALHAAGPEEDYVQIYNQIQDADRLAQNQRPDQARATYLEAQTSLGNLSRQYPDWNPHIVRFRLGYIARKLDALSAEAGSTAPAVVPAPGPATPGTASDREIEQLRGRVRQLESEKSDLSARLREALAARPAAVDPQELAIAEARILAQQKEIELLKINLDKTRSDATRTPDPELEATRQALADAQQQLAQQTDQISTLTLERSALQNRLLQLASASAPTTTPSQSTQAPGPGGPGEIDELKSQLQSLHQRLSEEEARNKLLVAEKTLLEHRLDELPGGTGESELSKRIRNLETELETARQSNRTDATTISALQTALASANQELNALQVRIRALQPQSAQARLDAMLNPGSGAVPAAGAVAPSAPVATNSVQSSGGQTAEQAELEARLAMLEARRVPYSPEELALFKVPEISAATNTTTRTGGAGLSRDTALLIAEAEKALRAGRFSEAEEKYQQALAADQDNVMVLSSLASAQIEQGNLDQAEKTLGTALARDPDDAFSLFVLGRVRFEQGRVDEAMTALSRSAHLDGSRAETFNLLGIAMSQLGLRESAETALRRAVQLAPNYASAHHNLAVVYSTQNPPSLGLARWHYEKAIAGGHQSDPALEARLKGADNP
jgi:tetratricopeptide (TPR) repeat protein